MDISVVIPNYNGESLLSKNLPKVIEEMSGYKEGKTEIIVVDDFSQDKSVEVLKNFKQRNPNFNFAVNRSNKGFSSTVDRGAAMAKGEVLLLLNTDVRPEEGFLQPLLENFKDEKIFAVGCMDKSIENGKTILRGRGLGQWQRGFLVHRRGEVDKKNTLWVSGGSGAFRKEIWDKLGGLNELYNPFYWEDIDLSYRALKSGYKVVFEPKSVVIHEHEKGAIKSKYTDNQVKRIAYRNQLLFVWENATDFSLRLSHFVWLFYHLARAALSLDINFFAGFFNALILLPKVIKSLSISQKYFILSDKEVVIPCKL